MAVLVVDDITEVQDVVELITHLSRALATGEVETLLDEGTLTLTKRGNPTAAQVADLVRMDEEAVCEDFDHRDDCSCREDAASTDPRQVLLDGVLRSTGPVPYQPCSRRGTHQSLSDCWMCWSDVMRGATSLTAVLATDQ